MKHFTNFRWLLLSLLLAVGVGNAWGAETAVYTFSTAQSTSNTAYTTNYDVTINGLDWSVPGNQNFSGYVRIGGKNLSNVNRVITGKSPINNTISKITFNHNGRSNSSLTVNSVKLEVASNSTYSNIIETITLNPTIGVSTSGSFDFTPSQTWNNCYYRFTINVSNSNTSKNYGLDVTSIVFYETSGGPLTDPEFSFSSSTATWTSGSAFTAPTLSYVSGYDGTVQYSSSDATVATVSSNGTITPLKAGTTQIRAYAVATSTYSAVAEGDVYYTLTVVAPAAPTISPVDGTTFSGSQSVTISGASGNTIYYTTDGSTPTTSSTQYTGAFNVSGNVTVKAIQVDNDGIASAVASASYTDNSITTSTSTAMFGYTNWGKTASFSGTAYDEVTQTTTEGVVITYTRNDGSLYANQNAMRFYKSNTLKFEAPTGYVITHVEFTGTAWQSDVTTDVGTCTSTTSALSWDGSSASVTFTRPSNASSYATWNSATITLLKTSDKEDAGLVFKQNGETTTLLQMEVGDEVTLTFEQATTATVTFTMGNTDVATYNSSTGKVVAVSEGTTTLTATSPANSTYEAGSAVVTITVSRKAHGLEYSPTSTTLTVGGTLEQPTLSNPNNLSLTYNTSDATVATVSNAGVIALAGGTGQAVITATFAGDATYAAGSATFTINVVSNNQATYTKITSTSELEEGDYLIVCESSNVIFDGSRNTLDAVSNNQEVTINSNSITTNTDYEFTISAVTGGYSIQSHSGYYIGSTAGSSGNNELKSSTETVYTNTISFDNGDAVITGTDHILKYNPAANNERFRYFKTSTQNVYLVQLYKKNATPSEPYVRFADISKAVEFEANKVVTPQTAETNVTVTYSITDATVATIDSSTGELTLLKIGDAEVHATSTEDATLEALYYLHVTAPNIQLFTKVDDPDEFVEGGEYLLVQQVTAGTTTANAYNGQSGTADFSAVQQVTIQNDYLIDNSTSQAHVLTLERAGDDQWYIKDITSNKYLYWTSGNKLYFSDTKSDNDSYKWILSVHANVQYCQNASNTEEYLRYNSNNGQERFACYNSVMTQVVFYKKATALANANLSFTTPSYNVTLGNAFTSQLVNNPNNATPVKYFSNNPGVAEVDVWTGKVTIKRSGTVQIRATHYGSYLYHKSQAFYTIDVTKVANDGLLFNETFDKLQSTGGTDGEYLGQVGQGYLRTETWTGKKPSGSSWESAWETDETWTTFDTNDTPSSPADYSYVQAAAECVKFGGGNVGQNSKGNGLLVSREINFNGGTEGTLTFSAAGFGTDWNSQTTSGQSAIMNPNTLTVSATNCTLTFKSHTGNSTVDGTSITLVNGEWDDFTYVISNVTGNVVLTFEGYRGFLDDIAVGGPYQVTIGSTGYTSLYFGAAPLEVPAGITAYTVHAVDDNGYTNVAMVELNKASNAENLNIHEGMGVILQGTPGTYNFPFYFATDAVTDEENILMGSDEVKLFDEAGYEYFVLGKKDGNVGFYHMTNTNGGKWVRNGAHKAFFRLPEGESILNDNTTSAAMRGGFVIEDLIATAIEKHEQEQAKNNVYYNLAGQRVMTPTKGIYIVNGKKVLYK